MQLYDTRPGALGPMRYMVRRPPAQLASSHYAAWDWQLGVLWWGGMIIGIPVASYFIGKWVGGEIGR